MRAVGLYLNYLFSYYHSLFLAWILTNLLFPLNVEQWHVVNSEIFIEWVELKQGVCGLFTKLK